MPEITPIFNDLEDNKNELKQEVKDILLDVNRLQEHIAFSFVKLFNRTWRNKFTVEEILEEMGPNAGPFFDKASALVTFLLTHANVQLNPSEYVPLKRLKYNEDGTVEVIQ